MTEDLTAWLRNTAKEAAKDPATNAFTLAEKAVKLHGSYWLQELAIREVTTWINHYRRNAALGIERTCTIEEVKEEERQLRIQKRRDEKWAKIEDRRKARPELFEQWRLDPATGMGKNGLDVGSPDEHRAFIRSMGVDKYREWYVKGCRSQPKHFEAVFYIDADVTDEMVIDWRGGAGLGTMAHHCNLMKQRAEQAAEELANKIRLDVTNELLETMFALGNGQTVSWGKATIRDHEQRFEMLTKQAGGVIATAARHNAAIRMLKESGASCLTELEQQLAQVRT